MILLCNGSRKLGLRFFSFHGFGDCRTLSLTDPPSLLEPTSDPPLPEKTHFPEPPSMASRKPTSMWRIPVYGLQTHLGLLPISSTSILERKIMLFCQQQPRDICILSAAGDISTVTLSQPGSSARTVTYEGEYKILNLSGAFDPHESGGGTLSMSILFASPDGRLAGGALAGPLVAATPVQVIVGSFTPYVIRSRPTAAVPVSAIPMSNLR